MTKIAIPPDLTGMFAACEDAYEQATQQGFAENAAVIAAATELKSAWQALHLANCNYTRAKGVFSIEFAAIRVDRACRATRAACITLQTAIKHAAAEHRLYDRCLKMTNHSRNSDQIGEAVTPQQNERLRRLA
jgi:hypothetical protein